jgi:antitoxin component YwqK of YwqJK toxin-antitoxin module
MNRIIIIFLIGILASGCTESSTEVKIIEQGIPEIFNLNSSSDVSIKNGVVSFQSIPYSGYLYEMQPNQVDTMFITGYIGGKKSGISKKWYPNLQLMEFREYSHGEKHGAQLGYWENGNKRFEFVAENGVYSGELQEWAESGLLIHLGTYVDGKEVGAQKAWDSKGNLKTNYVMKDGKRYGLLGTKNCTNVSDSVSVSM